MNIRAPWQEVKRVLLWAAAVLILLAGSALMTGESDLRYMLTAALPYILILSAAALWMVWKRMTAPKWAEPGPLNCRVGERVEAKRPLKGVSSEALVTDKAEIVKSKT